jgi:hypothetical protein
VGAVEAMRVKRPIARGALWIALALIGCSLNPQPDDPGASALDSNANKGATSGAGGTTSGGGAFNYGGLPTSVPPPGAGGAFGSGTDAGPAGGGPIISPRGDASAERDAGPGDAGDARADRDPVRD